MYVGFEELKQYQKVQNAARFTLDNITDFIRPGLTEIELVEKCHDLQCKAGVDGYWYKSLPALILAGNHTTLAISSVQYEPNNIPIQENDLVTIDLHPSIAGYCGDYARSFYVENGVARRSPLFNQEFIAGAHAQSHLHALLLEVAHVDMTFSDLHQIMSKEIEQLSFEALNYLGHAIQKDMHHLEFIAPDVTRTLGDARLFTLEPQIRLLGGHYGFKNENIYYFKNNKLREL
jgi:Xaa-Pro aminopeptidase